MAALDLRGGHVLGLGFSAGYDSGPAVGPGGRGSTAPGVSFPARSGGFAAGQGGRQGVAQSLFGWSLGVAEAEDDEEQGSVMLYLADGGGDFGVAGLTDEPDG